MRRRPKLIEIISIVGFLFAGNCWSAEVLKGSLIALPGVIVDKDTGIFVDVLKEIEACLPKDVTVERTLYPPARANSSVMASPATADFVFPGIVNPLKPTGGDHYSYTKPYGRVSFVIYSNKNKPITREQLLNSKSVSPFPYSVETFPGIQDYYQFKTVPFSCLVCSLKKVAAGRSDAIIAAMDEVDVVIRQNKLNTLHRELYEDLEAPFVVPKTSRGEHVAKLLNDAIDCANKSGALKKKYELVHKPYEKWQPGS